MATTGGAAATGVVTGLHRLLQDHLHPAADRPLTPGPAPTLAVTDALLVVAATITADMAIVATADPLHATTGPTLGPSAVHPPQTVRRSSPQSRSTSSGHLSLDDKRELLEAAKANAMKILGVEKLELPESVKPILSEESEGSKQSSPEPETRVRHDPAKTLLQTVETEPDDISNLKMSPRRRIITFSINNSVAKPTVSAPSCAKVTPRVDNYESRKPYGHWVPVKSRKTSSARKHTLTKSH
uniref:Arginine/serine-rich protein 1 n=1 Tax=Echeneis naucrates TaxID=173247 RepID=A0A665TXM5_ECHNA